jgi:multidrug efflux pump subunit AcrA (membrane-fusion protein)
MSQHSDRPQRSVLSWRPRPGWGWKLLGVILLFWFLGYFFPPRATPPAPPAPTVATSPAAPASCQPVVRAAP